VDAIYSGIQFGSAFAKALGPYGIPEPDAAHPYAIVLCDEAMRRIDFFTKFP
jgi:hypothetical protein